MNPRPKTINPGFYILISKFKIGYGVSFEMDTAQYILRCSTVKVQAPLKAVLLCRRPELDLQKRCQEDGSRLKQLQRSYNRLRLSLGFAKFTS